MSVGFEFYFSLVFDVFKIVINHFLLSSNDENFRRWFSLGIDLDIGIGIRDSF